jgi:hypothetical protein
MTAPGCAHRWGHGRPSRRPPDALLADPERVGEERPPRWPTPLLCLDCGVLWPGEPLPGERRTGSRDLGGQLAMACEGTGVPR